MDYAVHNVPSYQHLQGKATPAHMGSKNSDPPNSGAKRHIYSGPGQV